MVMMRVRTIITVGQGLPGLFTLYFNGSSPTPITADATDVCARVRTFANAIIGLLPTGQLWSVQPAVDLVDSVDGQLAGGLVATTPALVTGTGGTVAPTATEMLLAANTGLVVNGRRLQGRSFIGPCAITVVSGTGQLGPTQQTTLQNAANVMISGSTTSFPVVWHRPKKAGPGGVPAATPGTNAAVTSFTARAPLAVLRSRRD